MKKLSPFLVLILVLIISGCDSTPQTFKESNLTFKYPSEWAAFSEFWSSNLVSIIPLTMISTVLS
ncbi:MAG: hypothetical protein Q8N08_05920 [Methanobacteriaceae archaeon]|nr:hypothetical protein [Methanobacteriaceae archaeon]